MFRVFCLKWSPRLAEVRCSVMLRRAVDNLVPQKRLRSVFEYLRQNMQKLLYAGVVVVGIEIFATIASSRMCVTLNYR